MTKENLDKQSIKKYAENAYLNYSMYVILDRAYVRAFWLLLFS